jgi:SHS2 domain-containing protein
MQAHHPGQTEGGLEQDSWEHFEHEADIGVRGIGHTLAAAFEQAALAMTALITDLELIKDSDVIDIHCEDDDSSLLLTDWLNALIYEMATRKWVFCRFQVTIDGNQLTAVAWGEPIDMARHQPAVEVKGATFTELAVYQEGGRYVAQCVVDV